MKLMMLLVRVPEGTTTEHVEECVCVALAEQFAESEVVECNEADDACLM